MKSRNILFATAAILPLLLAPPALRASADAVPIPVVIDLAAPPDAAKQDPPLSGGERVLQRLTQRIARMEERGSTLRGAAPLSAGELAQPGMSQFTERRPVDVVGVYLTPASAGRGEFFLSTTERMGERGGNALVFDVKGSAVFFDTTSEVAQRLGLVQKRYDLPALLRVAKERGIYTIARFVAIKDAGLTARAPETLVRHPVSGTVIGYEWVDPEHPLAVEYNRQVVCDLASLGINEINLDYIRFSTAEFGALRAYSTEEKSRKVETFIRAMREAIEQCGPATKLGLSTYAILGWNYDVNVATLGQDVVRFAPLVDVISPMAYPATFTAPAYYDPQRNPGSRMYWLVYRTLTGYQKLLGPEQSVKLRPWIQGYGATVQNMQDEMKAVADAGLCGFTVWNANNAYETTYKALPSFRRPAGCGG